MLDTRRIGSVSGRGAVLALALLAAGGSGEERAPAAPPPPADVAQRLVLVGDAGKPDRRGEPVLAALGRELARDPVRTAVVFLGDNLYPRGLSAPEASDRAEMERRLDAQVDVVVASGARGLFVPGNHDWENGKDGGWEAVRRQERRVEERGGALVSYAPDDGCPGPEVVDLGSRLRLVALDTQWWLHAGPRPLHPTSSCPADSEEEILARLGEALGSAGGRHVIVVAHHPLASGGPHGGRFTFRQHVFPLTDLKKGLWIPLPLVGSLYPLFRKAGITDQDLGSKPYRHFRDSLVPVLGRKPPLVYAAGHEHSLQVFEGPGARYTLVSGAGIYGHQSHAARIEGSLFARGRPGFMRLDLEAAGGVRLTVLEVDRVGRLEERFSTWLTGP